MNTRILLGLTALLALVACTAKEGKTTEANFQNMPKVEGCTIERFRVDPGGVAGVESVYIVRCKPLETTSVSTRYSCGKNCTKKVTTITTMEGSPDPSPEKEIPQ